MRAASPVHRWPRRAGVLAAAAVLVFTSACTEVPAPRLTPPPSTASTVVVDADVPYREVDGTELVTDVCRPRAQDGALPVVLLIHGGGFSEGSKDDVRGLCERLAEQGYAAMAIQYRLLPESTFPAQVLDAVGALTWASSPEAVARYGFDPQRVAVLGTSAGAIIAESLGVGMGDPPVVPRAVVAFSGASDFTGTLAPAEGASPQSAKLASGYLGCRDLDACPVAREASPVFRVTAQSSPLLQVIGSDELIPVDQAKVMDQAMADAGAEHQLVVVPGSGHGLKLLDRDTTTAVDEFLHTYL